MRCLSSLSAIPALLCILLPGWMCFIFFYYFFLFPENCYTFVTVAMKKFFTLFFLILIFYSSSIARDVKTDSLISRITNRIAASLDKFNFLIYPDLSYLRDEYKLPNLEKKDDSVYIKKLDDYYYKRFYPNGKLLDRNFYITEDCITQEENADIIDAYKLFYYSLYDNIRLPNDYVKRLEMSSMDGNQFFSSYYTLRTIYYLKKFNAAQLSAADVKKVNALRDKLCNYLYDAYIVGKPWGFYKIVSVNLLMINQSPLIKNIDINELIDPLEKASFADVYPYAQDAKDIFLMNSIGVDKVMQMQAISQLWIILLKEN